MHRCKTKKNNHEFLSIFIYSVKNRKEEKKGGGNGEWRSKKKTEEKKKGIK